MKRKRNDYLTASLMLLCIGAMFLFLNRGIQTYLVVHFSLLHFFESALLLVLALLPSYQQSVLRRTELYQEEPDDSIEQEEQEEQEEDEDDDREEWKPVTGAAVGIFFVLLLGLVAAVAFFLTKGSGTTEGQPTPVHAVLCVVVFILYACVQKWWSVKGEDGADSSSLCRLMLLDRVVVAVLCAALLLSYTGLADVTRLADLLVAGAWLYLLAASIVGLVVHRIRRPDSDRFDLFLPIPFYKAERGSGVLDWLEKNTGLSMRSLWSLKFLRVSLPTYLLGGIVLLWLSTCLVQVDASQLGALYHFGKLTEEDILEPGLHVKLPVPFETVKVYDVTHPQTMKVGYEGEEDTQNNLWTLTHGGEEHKLLLGDGRELVAINLKINYRINDLYAYLTNYAKPEEVLNAKGYEIVMHATVNTDVDTIMSVDRSALSQDIKKQLSDFADQAELGLEVTGVTLASIHPPVEISDIYQSVVSAGIQKKAATLEAEGAALAAKEQAEADRQVAVNQAGIDKDKRTALAKAEAAEYNAAIAASRLDPESFRLERYLEAVQKSMAGKKKYLLGPGVDQENLYSGFLNGLSPKVSEQPAAGTDGKANEQPKTDTSDKTNGQSETKPDGKETEG